MVSFFLGRDVTAADASPALKLLRLVANTTRTSASSFDEGKLVNAIYVATGESFALITPGDSWHVETTLPMRGVQCLAMDAHQTRIVFAGSRGHGVWRSSDGGQSWSSLSFPEPDVFSLAVSPVDSAVYAGCEPSRLFVSRDGGDSWSELETLRQIPSAPQWSYPPRPETSHVRAIAPSPRRAGLLLVGIELGGVMRSEDGGETWSDHRTGAQKDVHSLDWHPSVTERVYEAAGGGTTWSDDEGLTWHEIDDGRDRHYTWALAVDPSDPDTWFVSAAPSPRHAHGDRASAEARIYRWRGGGPWQTVLGKDQPLDSFPYALAIDKHDLVAGLRDGRLLVSEDRGESWSEAPLTGDELKSIRALAIV